MLNSTVLLVGSLVLGQAAEGPPSAYQHLKDQEVFVGEWEGKTPLPDTMPADAPDWAKKLAGKTLTIRVSTKWGPEKGYQVVDLDSSAGGMSVKGTNLKTWDPAEGKIKELCSSSIGGWQEVIWTKENAKTWKLEKRGVRWDGKETSSVQTITLVNNDTYVTKSTNRLVDGKPQPDTEFTGRRVKPAAKPAK
jgi:hypothetical protein